MNMLRRKIVATILFATIMVGLVFVSAALANGGRPLHAALSSENEVPSSGTGATGSAHVTLNQGQGEVCVQISTQGLAGDVIAGHIHVGEAGSNGGVVVNLGVNASDFSGCVNGVDADVIKAIRQHPESYYINIHTTAVPSGEVRGQLEKPGN